MSVYIYTHGGVGSPACPLVKSQVIAGIKSFSPWI